MSEMEQTQSLSGGAGSQKIEEQSDFYFADAQGEYQSLEERREELAEKQRMLVALDTLMGAVFRFFIYTCVKYLQRHPAWCYTTNSTERYNRVRRNNYHIRQSTRTGSLDMQRRKKIPCPPSRSPVKL